MSYQTIVKELVALEPLNPTSVQALIREKVGEYKLTMPDKSLILRTYRQMVESQEIKPNEQLERVLRRRQIRTLSGVAPITVMTAPLSCPSDCVYCPTEAKMPKSYLSNQPAAMRAVLAKFDPYKQTITRLDTLYNNGHFPEKIEIIINGGTWSAHPIRYKTWFIKRIFDACNEFKPYTCVREDLITTGERKTLIATRLKEFNFDWFQENKLGGVKDDDLMAELEKAQALNEASRWKIIGLTLETRPDYITVKEIAHMRKLGCTKVELGVQTLYDDVQILNNRGHDTAAVARATKLLREAGFKIAYHMMPNLHGSTPERDVKMFEELFTDSRFQPDHLKVYPCLVVKEAKLNKLFESGKYKPYSDEVMFETLLQCKLKVAPYCRISRLMRDIPSTSIEGGVQVTNIRENLQREIEKRRLTCRCIRCREARDSVTNLNEAVLVKREYVAADGREFFISYETPDEKKIFAFVRLRIPQLAKEDPEGILAALPELKGCAHVRELHTYGKLVPLKKDEKDAVQHMGFGKRLMLEAENLARELGIKKMAVISGIGVREYYRMLGYWLEGTYMIKDL